MVQLQESSKVIRIMNCKNIPGCKSYSSNLCWLDAKKTVSIFLHNVIKAYHARGIYDE